MINYFTIPDSYVNFELNQKLIHLWGNHPEFFHKNVMISSVFGCPGSCIWNGNRLNKFYPPFKAEISLDIYKDEGIDYNFTFTNFLLEEKHLSDTLGNYLAKIGESEGNSVIVASELMENYIRKNYPKYKIKKSIINFFNDTNKINVDTVNKMSEKDMVVLPLKWNNDFEILKKLTHPENIEVLVNQPCIENCPFSINHYTAYNKANLYMPVEPWELACRFEDNEAKTYKKSKTFISYDLLSKYNEIGIHHFKIAGRDFPELALEGYADMFVKEDYQELVVNYLLRITDKDLNWNSIENNLFENSFKKHPKVFAFSKKENTTI